LKKVGVQLGSKTFHAAGAQHYAAAKPLCERALAICEKTLGAEHPLTKDIRENLSRLGNS
jgi:hypothetical protein